MGASLWHYTFIDQLVGRHEGLFNPGNSCLPRASSPEGDMNFLGWKNLRVSWLTGQLIVYFTERWRRTYYQGNIHWIEVLHTNGLSFSVSETWRAKHVLWRHSPSRRSAVPWDATGRHGVWMETRRFVFPPRDCSRPLVFLYSSYQFHEV